jgi:hypothetical protein
MDPTEVQEALAHARGTYLELETFAEDRRIPPEGDPPVCEIHGIPMTWQKCRKGSFWSCHQRIPDGS